MDIKPFIDSTYLKDNREEAIKTIKDAIDYGFKLVMIKPEMVSDARKMIDKAKSRVLIGTVIDFPKGQGSADDKVAEALQAVSNGVDEIEIKSNISLISLISLTTLAPLGMVSLMVDSGNSAWASIAVPTIASYL